MNVDNFSQPYPTLSVVNSTLIFDINNIFVCFSTFSTFGMNKNVTWYILHFLSRSPSALSASGIIKIVLNVNKPCYLSTAQPFKSVISVLKKFDARKIGTILALHTFVQYFLETKYVGELLSLFVCD